MCFSLYPVNNSVFFCIYYDFNQSNYNFLATESNISLRNAVIISQIGPTKTTSNGKIYGKLSSSATIYHLPGPPLKIVLIASAV